MKFKTPKMGFKGKNRRFLLLAGFAMILLIAVSLFALTSMTAAGFDPITDSGTADDPTDLTPVDNTQPQATPTATPYSPTPTPYHPTPTPWNPQGPIMTPTPTPYQTQTPTQAPPTATPTPMLTAHVWQTLYIQSASGNYWVNAPKPFNPAAIFGSPSGNGDDYSEVYNEQNNIYMNIENIPDNNPITSWSFTGYESINCYRASDGQLVTEIAHDKYIFGSGGAVTEGQNTWITGASFSAESLQSQIQSHWVPYFTGHFTITLSTMTLTLHFQDGSTQNLYAREGNDQNTLQWLIRIQ